MSANNTTPVAPSQFQPWASFFGGNVTAPYANPTAFGANALGAPPSNGQYTGGWAYPDAWANFYEGTQGFTAPQNQNSPAGALAAANYAQNNTNPNDPNLLGWESTYGNPFTTLQRDQNWAQSLGDAPTGTPSNELTGGWQNPEAWAAFYGGFNGFTAPENAGSPASALAAASQIAQTSSPESNPALLGWIQDYGQPGTVLANTPNWAASLGDPNVNAMGQGVDQTNTQGWTSPLAWAAYYGGFQGYNAPVDNTLEAAQNWAGVTDQNNPSLLGWTLDYGDPQTVVSTIQASPEYQAYLAALAEQERLANLPPSAPAPAPVVTRTRSGKKRAARQAAAAAQAAADAAYYTAKPVSVNGAGAAGSFVAASGYGSSIAGATSYAATIPAATSYGSNIAGSPSFTAAQVQQGAAVPGTAAVQQQVTLVPGTDITSFVTRGVDGSKVEIRSDGSIYINGQLNTAPVRALQSARLYNTAGSGTNVPSFGTNNLQGSGAEAGAFGLSRLPPASGAAVGGDPFNALYSFTNTTFAQAGTAGETVGEGTPAGGPINPLYAFRGGEGGHAGAASDNPDMPFSGAAVYPNLRASNIMDRAFSDFVFNYGVDPLIGVQQGFSPGLTAPGDFNSGFVQMPPPEIQPNVSVDDYGRVIPDVGPPEPFSLPDFGGLATSIEQTLGNLGAGWTPPAQPETPAPNFPVPDFGGLEQTIQQTLSGLLPGWTPPSQPEEQPGTFWGNVLSGLGNLGIGFNPITPDTSGINPEVSIDQVAQQEITVPQGSGGEFGAPPPFVPRFSELPTTPTEFPGGFGGFAPQAFEGTYTAPPADVFTDPGMGNAGFGASTLYQGGYGEPELEPQGPELSGDTKLQKASDLLAKTKGLTFAQFGRMFGLAHDPRTPVNVDNYRIDITNLPKAAADIWAMLPTGASAVTSEAQILQQLRDAYSTILRQAGTDPASVQAARGAQSWDISGLPQATQQYNTVPIYGDLNSGIPSYGAPGQEAGFPRPPADVGPQGPPRPPAEIPDSFAQGSPFAGAPNEARGEQSYTPGTMGFLHGMQNLYGQYGGSIAQTEEDARAIAEQLGLNFKVLGGSGENIPAQIAAVKEYLANNYDLSALLGFSAGASSVRSLAQQLGDSGLTYMTVAGPGPKEGFYAPEASHMQQLGMFGDYLADQSGEGFGLPPAAAQQAAAQQAEAWPGSGSGPSDLEAARASLLRTAQLGTAALHGQGGPTAEENIARLYPPFIENLSRAIDRANAELGFNLYLSSGYRDPTALRETGQSPNAANFDAQGRSIHSTGAAGDLGNMPTDRANQLEVRRIFAEEGVIFPYAIDNTAEMNHVQMAGTNKTPTAAGIQLNAQNAPMEQRWQALGLTSPQIWDTSGYPQAGEAQRFTDMPGENQSVIELGNQFQNTNWDQFEAQARPSQNIEDVRSPFIPAAEPESLDYRGFDVPPLPTVNTGPPAYNLGGQGYGGGTLPAPYQGEFGGLSKGGMVGPVLPTLTQIAQAGYNYFYPPTPTFDAIANIPSLEPTFAQQLAPQQLPEESTFASMPVPMGAEPSFADMPYSPPADVFAAEDPSAMQFQGGPLAGRPSAPFPSSADVTRLAHGMYPVGTVPHTPEYQVFTGQPDPNTIYAPHNTTNFGDVGSYVDPSNRGQFNLTINPTGQSGYNTNLGGVSLPWSGTYDNAVLVQAPNGEWQYLPIVDKGPNQTARSQGELDILNASLPGFGYEDRAHMPGAGWLYKVMNPQSGMLAPPIVNPQGGPYAGQQWFTGQPAAPVLRFVP